MRAGGRGLDWRFGLAPAGGAVAAACFFLPWGRFSFLVMHREASGPTVGGSAWAIFAVAVIVLAGGALLAWRRRPRWLRSLVFGAALLGLLLFVAKANELAHGIWTPFGHLQPQDVGVKPGLGARGTVVGFFLAIAGSLLVPEPWPRWLPRWRALIRRREPASIQPITRVRAEGAPAEALPVGATAVGAPGDRTTRAEPAPVAPMPGNGSASEGAPGGLAAGRSKGAA